MRRRGTERGGETGPAAVHIDIQTTLHRINTDEKSAVAEVQDSPEGTKQPDQPEKLKGNLK